MPSRVRTRAVPASRLGAEPMVARGSARRARLAPSRPPYHRIEHRLVDTNVVRLLERCSTNDVRAEEVGDDRVDRGGGGPGQAVRQTDRPTARPGGRARARCWRCWALDQCRQDTVRPDDPRRCSGRTGHAPGGGARRAARAAGGPTTTAWPDSSPRSSRRSAAGRTSRWWRVCSARDRRAARADSTGPGAAWPGRGRRPAGPNVLGRHAAQARPGREPGGFTRLLLLDEPTTGLDPRSRVELWDAIRSMVEEPTSC